MAKDLPKITIAIILLAFANILLGIFFILIILLMQGIFAFLLGLLYVFLGILILLRKSYFWLLFCGVIPTTLLLTLNIIMMGVNKEVPSYYQTPLWVGIPLLVPFWAICIFDTIYLLKKKSHTDKP